MDTTSAPQEGQHASPKAQEATPKQRVPLSCTKAFDSVYFCYSPVHQARQYYITGELDDCRGRLKKFRMCMMSRFRPQSESEVIYEEEEKKDLKARGMEHVKPVWELRETYLQNVARAEEAEREARDRGEDVDDDGWWL